MQIPIKTDSSSWSTANREVLWGWKRDSGPEQRTIVFGASLSLDVNTPEVIRLKDWFFFYRSRSQAQEISQIFNLLASDKVTKEIGHAVVRKCGRTKLDIVELSGGPGLIPTWPLIKRLLNRRPRRSIPTGAFPPPTATSLNLRNIGPIAAYVGSGLSYESGIPTLAAVHETFGVDRIDDDSFTFGTKDPIPRQLAESVTDTFSRFTQFHLLSAVANPSWSHRQLAALYGRGLVTRILTDNVDNLLAKLDVPFTRTRGIGIFNDKFPVQFDRNEKTLLVIGVAADRRLIIRQARQQGLKIVVVNPEEPVSPRSQSLSYLQRRDRWYRNTAHEFFQHYAEE